ncbi:hypothetical protein M3Y99_01338100 [Aphelenchoides fujianensis]|nr:hypothetical protein M3Y99_01338100 [Aphelenchoides fujianensis]
MPPITSAAMSCLVCSETPASKHYGSYSCSGCKGFFRRSVRQHRVYYCSYNNDCVIRKEFRNCCRACRMQKCLMIGMSPKLVHSDRGALGKAKQFERPGDSPVDLPSDFSPTSTTFGFNLQQMAPDSTSALRASGLALSPGSCSSIDAPPFAFNPQLAGMAGWFPQWQQARDTSLFINSSATMLETDQGPLGVRQWIPLFDRSNADQVVTYFLQVDKMLDQFAEFEHNHVSNPKSRGSSVGHSREGSSDDGFGSSGRQTLSPSSISSSNIGAQNFNANYTQPSNVVHQRQASAPELINHSPMHHHHLPPHQPREARAHAGSAGLPPVAYSYHSKSLSTAALASHPPVPYGGNPQPVDGAAPHPAVYHHQRAAKSCDFDAAGSNNAHNDVAMRSECIEQQQQTAGGSMHQMNAYNSPPAAHFWDGQQPRAKSQSLDPLSISLAPQSSGKAAPVHPHSSGAMGGHHHSLSAIPTHSGMGDDGLGPLPAGWAKDCTETGAVYFIDHNNKTTTWNDPRLAHETQPDHMRMRQSFGRMKSNSGGAISFPSANGGVYGASPQLPSLSNQYGMPQGMDLVQQLKMERTSMAERQQQLQQQGLLDQQQQSPHQTQAAQQFGSPPCHLPQPPQSSPYNPPHLNSNGGYPMQHAPMPMEMYGSPDFAQPRSSANESMDNTMEVDFQNGMQHSLFDPALVEDTAGINPHEFDKYLRINEGQRQSTTAAKYQM